MRYRNMNLNLLSLLLLASTPLNITLEQALTLQIQAEYLCSESQENIDRAMAKRSDDEKFFMAGLCLSYQRGVLEVVNSIKEELDSQ